MTRTTTLAGGAVALLALGACLALGPREARQLEIAHVEYLGEIWGQGQRRAHVLFQDGAASFPVPGGAVWLFGDTFLGTRDADGTPRFAGGLASTTIALRRQGGRAFPPDLEYRVTASGVAAWPFHLFPDEPSPEFRIWPAGGVHLGGRNYVFYSLIQKTEGPGPWNFRGVGDGLARSDTPLGDCERVVVDGDWRFPVNPAHVQPHGEWLYLYQGAEVSPEHGLLVARVRPEQIENPRAYEFWTGPGPTWSPRREDARLQLVGTFPQASVAWSEHLGRWLMASSSDIHHPREIRFHVAEEPWGPWSEPVARMEIPERPGKTTVLIYCTYFHPELFEEGGRRVNLTYCRMLSGEWELTNPEMAVVEWAP